MLLNLKFLDGLGECRFEVGGDVGLNIPYFFLKTFTKYFHRVRVYGVDDGGDFRNNIVVRHD